jgi:uncharacterized membrane protein YeaQ/YmgE (transglycosylase-associated protein family)
MKRNLIRPSLQTFAGLCAAVFIGLALWTPVRGAAADLDEKVSSAAGQATKAIEDTGKAAASKIEEMWRRVDEARLKNRTRDEIVAWVLMGLLVGCVLAQFAGVGRFVAVLLGLVGSFVGGIVVHVAQIDVGLGPVLIRYEDLLFSMVGGLLMLIFIRVLMKRKKSKS